MATSPQNLENTHLSFANPNYKFEDKINSNMDNKDTYQTDSNIYDEIDSSTVSLLSKKSSKSLKKCLNGVNEINEKKKLLTNSSKENISSSESEDEISSDEENGEKETNYSNKTPQNDNEEITPKSTGGGFLGYYSMLESKAREKQKNILSPDSEYEPESAVTTPGVGDMRDLRKYALDINSPDSNDSGIQSDARSDDGVSHVQGPSNEDLYAIVNKSSSDSEKSSSQEITPTGDNSETDHKDDSISETESLPPGWEKCEDEDGPYYWHIKSGTIQREPPSPAPPDTKQSTLRSISCNSDSSTTSTSSIPSTPTSISSNTEDHLQAFEGHALQYAVKSLQSLTTGEQTTPVVEKPAEEAKEKTVRFAVRSLGWVKIAEEDLTPERSSRAVNKCIVDLSLGRNDINDVVGRWGDGKDLYMDLDSDSLRLIDTQDFSTLNSQAIQSIRVWGVGRDNGRDFAYVARDKATKKHMCHVFRCDSPARQIANTLRDICKKIMIERRLQQNAVAQRLSRPTDLPNLDKTSQPNGQKLTFQGLLSSASFPTPMEEPKKVMRCHYIGTELVPKPTGTDVINSAITVACNKVPPEKWIFVNVAIAPSTITITEHGKPDNKIEECRVRFLSFMGISTNDVKLCSFIIHGAEDKFYAHIFHCEPSAGPLCKTIEAACKLRYQKCLDAHPQTPTSRQQNGKLQIIGEVLKDGVKSSAQSVQTGVKAGVKASLQGVQNVFSLIKNKTIKRDPS